MRSRNQVAAAVLFLVGVTLCATNLWYAALRSTIPMAVEGTIESKRIGVEKHAGIDDVYEITLSTSNTMRIDKSLYDQLTTGDKLYKHAWQNTLQVNDQTLPLACSPDFYGLLWCMVAALAMMIVMIALPQRPSLLPQRAL